MVNLIKVAKVGCIDGVMYLFALENASVFIFVYFTVVYIYFLTYLVQKI